jgi:CRISPR/Cas system type I-B associated protein Csh2 (Cas7 group RAMP superfamily)
MSLSTLAKSKPFISISIQSFIFLHIHIQLDQITIFEIFFTQSVWNFNATQESKRTLCKVKVVSHEVNCFEHSQILLASLTDDHCVLQSNFSALLLDLVNQKPFLNDA